jgi:hypothetical protein
VDERLGGRRIRVGLIRAELEEIAHGEADATGEAGVKEFAAVHFAKVRRVFVPGDWVVVAHGVVVFRSSLYELAEIILAAWEIFL